MTPITLFRLRKWPTSHFLPFPFCPFIFKAAAALVFSNTCLATGFGIYDSRALAMGGATVAAATTDHAVFYNPALMSFHDAYEDESLDGRFYFPLLTAQASEAVIDMERYAEDDLDGRLSDAIAAFNGNQNQGNAQSVLSATADVQNALDDLAANDLLADVYVGIAITEPSKREGGGFFLGARVVGGGVSNITDADRALLGDYEEALQFVVSNGAQGEAHPELFDANGNLINPNDTFDSSLTARGVSIIEAGVTFSKEYELYGRPVALGITPKIWKVDTYEDIERVVDGRVERNENLKSRRSGNIDVGAAMELGQGWRLGLAIKDIIAHNYKTELDGVVKLRPRPRLGVAWQRGGLQLAFDADLVPSEPLGEESARQETALGAEWALGRLLKLRLGYRHDLESGRDDIISTGVGIHWRRFLLDAAYAESSDSRAVALQFGYAF